MFPWMWWLKDWNGNIQQATLPPLFGWLMVGEWELLCAVERLHHKNRKESPLHCRSWTKRVFKHASPASKESSRVKLSTAEKRLWCDCEKTWRPVSLKARTGGDSGCPLWGPVGLLRCHLHTMWQTPLVRPFFTLPHPLPSTFVDKWVKTLAWAAPQARTETVWTPPVTASCSITSHFYPLCSPPSLSFLSFSQAAGSLCSFCVYGTFTRVSPRHTPHVTPLSVATMPEARRSLRLELENHCDTSATALPLSYSLSITVMEEGVRSFNRVKMSIKQSINTTSESLHLYIYIWLCNYMVQ